MTNEQNLEETILLKVEDTPPCPRCDGATLLLARFPYAWKNLREEDVLGFKEAVLCPGCHNREPAAAELLALFAVDDQVRPENMDVFDGLVASWVESVRQRTVDEEALSAEFAQWQRGDL